MAQWTRDLYPSESAYRCEQHGHLWQPRANRDRLIIESPLGQLVITGDSGEAHKDGHMWTLYDCVICESVEAVWAH